MNFTTMSDSDFDFIINYIKTYQDTSFTQNILNSLAECTCCHTHQIDKPIIFSPLIHTTHNNQKSIKNCICPCRHMARHICRLYPDSEHTLKKLCSHNYTELKSSSKKHTSPPKLKKKHKHFSATNNLQHPMLLLQM